MPKKVFTALVILSALVYGGILYHMLFKGFGRADINALGLMRYNLVPFKTITADMTALIDARTRGYSLRNLAGNFFLLSPLGLYLPFLTKKTISVTVYAVATSALIVAVETAQLITMSGILDIDDFLLNFAGAFIGFLVCRYTPIRVLFELRAY